MLLHRAVLGSALVAAFVTSQEPPDPAPFVLDDAVKPANPGTTGFATINGDVPEGECGKAGYDGGFHVGVLFMGTQSLAAWNFTVPKSGCYWVEEFHPDTSQCLFTLSPTVPLQLKHKGFRFTGVVDQSQKAGQWNRLVKLSFDKRYPASINISPEGFKFKLSGLWAADAFRLMWHGKRCDHEDGVPKWKGRGKTKVKTKVKVGKTDPSVIHVTSMDDDFKTVHKEQFPWLQAVVDDADVDAEVRGATREPHPMCTTNVGFHHDNLLKETHSEVVFPFDAPQDGCYLVEEKHPECDAVASKNTKVHVNYAKGLQASGTVDQKGNPGQTRGQWTFIASLHFYAGHPGNVTLSNEGTESGTLAMFDSIRFTRTGNDCLEEDAHPRRAQIRMTVDFAHVADRLEEFGPLLKSKVAEMAFPYVSEKSFRLIGLRQGSIIAEFLVLPSLVDEPLDPGLTPKQVIRLLRSTVLQNRAELCSITADFGVLHLRSCNVDFHDLGIAMPTIKGPDGKALEQGTPVSEQNAYQDLTPRVNIETKYTTPETGAPLWLVVVVISFCVIAAGMICATTVYCKRQMDKGIDPFKRWDRYLPTPLGIKNMEDFKAYQSSSKSRKMTKEGTDHVTDDMKAFGTDDIQASGIQHVASISFQHPVDPEMAFGHPKHAEVALGHPVHSEVTLPSMPSTANPSSEEDDKKQKPADDDKSSTTFCVSEQDLGSEHSVSSASDKKGQGSSKSASS